MKNCYQCLLPRRLQQPNWMFTPPTCISISWSRKIVAENSRSPWNSLPKKKWREFKRANGCALSESVGFRRGGNRSRESQREPTKSSCFLTMILLQLLGFPCGMLEKRAKSKYIRTGWKHFIMIYGMVWISFIRSRLDFLPNLIKFNEFSTGCCHASCRICIFGRI